MRTHERLHYAGVNEIVFSKPRVDNLAYARLMCCALACDLKILGWNLDWGVQRLDNVKSRLETTLCYATL